MKIQEFPRSKLNRVGAAALTDAELIQVMIGYSGDGDKKIAVNLNALIRKIGADNITIGDIMGIKGIGVSKASSILASLEFWRRKFTKQAAPLIDTVYKAAEQFGYISEKRQEYFSMLTLNGAKRLIQKRTISVGTLMTSLVHPREVFAPAIEDRAASIIIGHNHPSGLLDVSEQDREMSYRIKLSGELLGINLDDHIIVAGDDFVSLY